MSDVNPEDFIISRKRKKYRFALFHNSPLCFEVDEWQNSPPPHVLEMGAGTGLFSVALASDSEQHFVAADVKADRLQTGARLAEEKGMTNLRFLRARADQLSELLTPNSLTTIWLTFPDPFPKDRAAKNRLTHSSVLRIYADLLNADGALYFKTDARALFEWSLEQLVQEGWRLVELSFDLHASDLPEAYKVQTTYESRYIQEGLAINFVKALPPFV